jgi:hypothetical protein
MSQQGQLLDLPTTGADGTRLWPYGYRTGGRARGVCSAGLEPRRRACEALERVLERPRRGQSLVEAPRLRRPSRRGDRAGCSRSGARPGSRDDALGTSRSEAGKSSSNRPAHPPERPRPRVETGRQLPVPPTVGHAPRPALGQMTIPSTTGAPTAPSCKGDRGRPARRALTLGSVNLHPSARRLRAWSSQWPTCCSVEWIGATARTGHHSVGIGLAFPKEAGVPFEDLLRAWPGEQVVIRFDEASGAWMFICMHSTVLGPAAGGTRLRVYERTS